MKGDEDLRFAVRDTVCRKGVKRREWTQGRGDCKSRAQEGLVLADRKGRLRPCASVLPSLMFLVPRREWWMRSYIGKG